MNILKVISMYTKNADILHNLLHAWLREYDTDAICFIWNICIAWKLTSALFFVVAFTKN